jgi:hypothetical protein
MISVYLSISQSYNRELQRQSCKNLQLEHFVNKIIFFSYEKALSYNSAGVVVVNSYISRRIGYSYLP